MSDDHRGHAAIRAQPSQPSEMEPNQGLHPVRRLLEESPTSTPHSKLFKTDEVSVGFHSPPDKSKHVDKQSLDYVIRSGVAGGLAGCAVSGKEQ